jgi:hypothetical protein
MLTEYHAIHWHCGCGSSPDRCVVMVMFTPAASEVVYIEQYRGLYTLG